MSRPPAETVPLTDAQQQLVADNQALLRWWLDTQVFRHFRVDEEDCAELIYRCQLCLILAAQRYDPTRGKFTTYAIWYIRSAVTDWRRVRERRRSFGKVLSLSMLLGEAWGACVEPQAPAYDPLSGLTLTELEAYCSSMLKPQQWRVLRLRVVDGWTLGEVGKALRLSKERIRQVEIQALQRLRAEPPPDYCAEHAGEGATA